MDCQSRRLMPDTIVHFILECLLLIGTGGCGRENDLELNSFTYFLVGICELL